MNSILQRHGVGYHTYAGGIQIYVSFKPSIESDTRFIYGASCHTDKRHTKVDAAASTDVK